MKKLVILLFSLLSFATYSQNKYEQAMNSTIEAIGNFETADDLLRLASKFERIAAAEQDKALPYYYSAYCYILLSSVDKDVSKIDYYLDMADSNIGKAEEMKDLDVELLVLRGFSSMMRITADPATRGQEYSMKSVEYLQRANQKDSKNPRALLMLGQMQFGTAQFFGTGIQDACNTFQSVNELYAKEEAEDRGLLPTWGKGQLNAMLQKCNSSESNN